MPCQAKRINYNGKHTNNWIVHYLGLNFSLTWYWYLDKNGWYSCQNGKNKSSFIKLHPNCLILGKLLVRKPRHFFNMANEHFFTLLTSPKWFKSFKLTLKRVYFLIAPVLGSYLTVLFKIVPDLNNIVKEHFVSPVNVVCISENRVKNTQIWERLRNVQNNWHNRR